MTAARHSIRSRALHLGLALLAACDVWPGALPAAPRCVTDDSGAELCLPGPAQRIVSLSPHLTELVYAAGAGERLVGAAEHSDYPPDAQNIARIGRSDRLDLERILALAPDLVLAWTAGNPASQLDKLEDLGLKLLHDSPQKLPDVARSLRRLGRLAGSEHEAETEALRYEQTLHALRQQAAGQPSLSVFYQVWDRPLYTVSGRHWISDVLQLCGGSNVFAGLSDLAPTVSLEAVLASDPQVILISGGAFSPAWIQAWHRWPQLRALRLQNLHTVDPDLLQRPTPRLLTGARQICAALADARLRAASARIPGSP